jgi:branched-chain amino acid transport system ATP-binding protein
MIAFKQDVEVKGENRNPALETRDLVVKFGGLTALSGVNLRILPGEGLRVIIGPNGAGKTTLFNVITGAVRHDSGTILFGGRDITGLPSYQICRLGISRTFQITSIFPDISVKENLWLGFNSKADIPWNPMVPVERMVSVLDRVDELCARVGLSDKIEIVASKLSHGDQRLLDIGIALSLDPDILLLDEPSQGVSPEEVKNINKVIKSIAKSRNVVMIDHDMATVIEVADIITVLDHGRVIVEGAPLDIIANKKVQEIYLGTSRD